MAHSLLVLMDWLRLSQISCLIMTVSCTENVSAVETGQGQGLYTIATEEEHVVVNSIIVSPFAFNHIVANLYCNIRRFVNAFTPGLLNSVRYCTSLTYSAVIYFLKCLVVTLAINKN